VVEQPVNLSAVSYLGVFSRAEQRVLQAIFKAIAEGGGTCVAHPRVEHKQGNHAQYDRSGQFNLHFFGQRPAFFGQTQAGERLGDQRKATREVIAGTAIEPHLPAALAGRCESHRA
jgi:hypothetical protein